MDGIRIRPGHENDAAAIHSVVTDAFGQAVEADLVDRLRIGGYVAHSLVAEFRGEIVGHVLLSRIHIVDGAAREHAALALAPVAVAPRLHGRGIGSSLIRESLRAAAADGHALVLVLGEPAYYGRFGFSSAQGARLVSPYPGEAFQALELVSGALDGLDGARVEYSAPFLAL